MDLTDLLKKLNELNNSDEFDTEPTVVVFDTDSEESFIIKDITTQDGGIFIEIDYSEPISEIDDEEESEDTDSE